MATSFDLPELPIESLQAPEETDKIQNTDGGAVDFAVIGSGQCGGRIAKAFYDAGVKKVLALNTAAQDLNLLDLPPRQRCCIELGGESGAGKDMARGKEAATKYHQQIFDLMRATFGKCEYILVTAGAGGGTGAGSLVPLLQNAKRYLEFIGVPDASKRVGAILTLPTQGELASEKVKANAKEVAASVGAMATAGEISPLLIIDNSKIQKLYRGLSMKDFWPTINNTLAGLFVVFNKLCNMDSEFTSFDPADYKSIVSCGGCCIMGVTRIEKIEDETAVSNALATNIEKTLLADGFDLTTAKFAGCIAVAGSKVIERPGMADMLSYGFDTLNNQVAKATCHRGIYHDPRPENASVLKVYTIIGGLAVPQNLVK